MTDLIVSDISIRIKNQDALYDLKEAMLLTMGKRPGAGYKERHCIFSDPGDEYDFWVHKILEDHSILRAVQLRLVFKTTKDIRNQLVRATTKYVQPYCQSSRPDWNNGKPRDPSEPVWVMLDVDCEGWLHIAQQRLCFRAEHNTRLCVLELVRQMSLDSSPLIQALGFCSVPTCVHLAGCPESATPTGSCFTWAKQVEQKMFTIDQSLIDRYTVYHDVMHTSNEEK